MNWEFDDALATADKHSFFKFMTKSVAEKHGLSRHLHAQSRSRG
jgi:glutamine synthetase